MTRGEQITIASQKYTAEESSKTWNHPDWEDVQFTFESGAEWADEHPNWHKYPDECPPRMGQSYIGCDENGFVLELCYTNDGNWNLDFDIQYDYNVIAWMELPEPPKFD